VAPQKAETKGLGRPGNGVVIYYKVVFCFFFKYIPGAIDESLGNIAATEF